MWFLAPKKFSAKLVKKWPRNGQKTLSRPKKVQKYGFWPQKNFQPNRSKNGQKTLSRPKKGRKCGVWPQINFQQNRSENGRNLAKRQFRGPKGSKMWFLAQKIFSAKSVKKWPKNARNMAKRCFHA